MQALIASSNIVNEYIPFVYPAQNLSGVIYLMNEFGTSRLHCSALINGTLSTRSSLEASL